MLQGTQGGLAVLSGQGGPAQSLRPRSPVPQASQVQPGSLLSLSLSPAHFLEFIFNEMTLCSRTGVPGGPLKGRGEAAV